MKVRTEAHPLLSQKRMNSLPPVKSRVPIGNPGKATQILAAAIVALSAPVLASAENWFSDRFSTSPPPVAAANLLEFRLDDLRRSGAHSIPDALRLVPGVNVAQQDAHTFAISARGSSDAVTNKLLVLMDGRSVYPPLFSGVPGDGQDTVLEDIDRAEVERSAFGQVSIRC